MYPSSRKIFPSHMARLPATVTGMRPLVLTAAITAAIGVVLAVFAGLTWPVWDSAAEYTRAVTSYAAAGAGEPDPTRYMFPPEGFYTGHMVMLGLSGLLIGIGILGGLLALHARAIRQAL